MPELLGGVLLIRRLRALPHLPVAAINSNTLLFLERLTAQSHSVPDKLLCDVTLLSFTSDNLHMFNT